MALRHGAIKVLSSGRAREGATPCMLACDLGFQEGVRCGLGAARGRQVWRSSGVEDENCTVPTGPRLTW